MARPLAAVAAAAAGAASAFPTIPSFSASLVQHPTFLPELGIYSTEWYNSIDVKYDAETLTSEWRMDTDRFAYVAPAYEHLVGHSVCGPTGCNSSDRNGTVCLPIPNPYLGPMMTMLGRAATESKPAGRSEVDGTPCDVWFMSDDVGNLTLCTDDRGLPLQIIAQPRGEKFGWSNVPVFAQNVTLKGLSVARPSIEPVHCAAAKPPAACPGQGVASKAILRFSSGEPWGHLEDRDAFDWDGFGVTGGFPGHWGFIGRPFLEVFDVEIDTSFGPWRDCNWNVGLKRAVCSPEYPPDLQRRIAKSAAEQLQGAEGRLGQCSDNDLVGSWHVFPHEGQCAEGAAVGDGGCTWKVKGFKVVHTQCLAPLAPYYKQDYQKGPFPDLVKKAQELVAGCPNVTSVIVV